MKRLLITLFVALLIPVSFSWGQEAESLDNLVWAGGEYDINEAGNSGKLALGYGRVLTGNLWGFGSLNIGTIDADNIDADLQFAYILRPFIDYNLYVGLLAGPGADWADAPSDGDDDIVTYLTGASGLLIGYDITKEFGVFGVGNYTFTFDNDATYRKNGAQILIGAFARF